MTTLKTNLLHGLMAMALATLVGCAGGAAPSTQPERATSEPGKEIVWVRDSAEYKATLVQTFRLASTELETLVVDLEPGSWAVSVDADETLISNLGYSLRRAEVGGSWTPESWEVWVEDQLADALPGALEFIATVRRLGGRVAVVTNRAEESCNLTIANLDAVGVDYDIVRCQASGEEGKEGRWEAIREGEGTGLPPLEIVMWIGDNIHDFPGLDQSSDVESMKLLGVRYFILPNPLYGSWEERPAPAAGNVN
jgi:5'-nucleotidase (lipoprotein e(P4) family)